MTRRTLVNPPGEKERIQERRVRAWGLRRAGGTVYSISEALTQLGFDASPATISNDLQAQLAEFRELEGEDAKAWRDDMIAKLDEIIKTQMELAATKSNIRAADSANAARMAMERKAKLLGIDAPVSLDVSVNSWTDVFRVAEQANTQEE